MQRSSNRSSRTTRFAHTILFSSILLSLGAASAQVVSVEATSTSIQGRAPVVSVSIENQTEAGRGLRPGDIARAAVTATDPDNDPIILEYRWFRDDFRTGAGETYELTADDSGKTLTVEVTARTNAETTDPTTTIQTASTTTEGTAPSVANVTITGDYRVGETLTASFDFIDPEDQIDEAGMVYQWYISDPSTGAETAIPGATGRTYKVASADQGVSRRFWFRVEKAKSLTGTPISQDRPAGQWEFTRNGEVRGRHPTAAPEIIGTAAVGQTLRVEPHYEDLDNDLPSSEGHFYQWIRVTRPDPAEGEGEETGVKGNGRDTYVVKEEDVGKYLQVVMYPRSQTGYPNAGEVKKAIITSPVTVASTAPTANPTIGGTVYVGRTLIGNANYQDVNNDPEGVHEYRWFSADDAAGTVNKTQVATTKDYVVRQEDGDKFLLLEVTPKSVEGTPEGTGTPVTVATSTAVPLPKFTHVFYEGSTKVGDFLSPKWIYSFPEGPDPGLHLHETVVATAPNAESVTQVIFSGSGSFQIQVTDTYIGLYYGTKITPVSSDGIHGKPVWIFHQTPAYKQGQAPKANPTLSGTFEVGQTLQGHIAFEDADNDPEGTHVLQWYRADDANGSNKVAIPGATGMSHVVTSEDMSKFLVFGVKARTTTGTPNEGAEEFASTGTRPSISNVDITGTFASGETLTGSFDLIDAENDQIDEAGMEYAWFITDPDTGAPTLIPNSNSRTLVLQPEHAAAFRRVWFSVEKAKTLTGIPNEAARPTDPAGQWQKTRDGLIVGDAPTATPTIEGIVGLGERLIGNVGYRDAQNDPQGTHTYQWYRATDAQGNDRTPIDNTNYDTYFPQASDRGYYLVFEVIPRSSTGTPNEGVATRAVTATPIDGTAPSVANVTFTGEFRVGETLTGSFDFIDPENDQIDEAGMVYQWYISDLTTGAATAIPGATGKTYKIVGADQAAHRNYWFRVEKVKTLTGTPNSQDRPAGQWEYRHGGAITGRIPTVAPQIIGASLVGTTLQAEPNYEDLDGDLPDAQGLWYRWYRQDSPDPAAAEGVNTGVKGYDVKSYTLTAADVGKYMRVIVHPRSATGYPSLDGEARKVTMTASVAHVDAMPTAKPTITGDLRVGQTLTGHAGYEDINNDPEGTHVYQWYRVDNVMGTVNRVAIAGATASTYVLQSEDLAKFIMLNVTPRSASGTPIQGEPTFSTTVGPAVVPGAPYALNLYVQEFSPPQVGSTVEAEYTWKDDEGDGWVPSIYDWCHVGGACGLSDQAYYKFKDTDVGQQIYVRVTPRAASGSPTVGTMVESAPYPKDGLIGIDMPELNPQWNYSPGLTDYSVNLNYSHIEGEGEHEIRWYRSPTESGENRTEIPRFENKLSVSTADGEGMQFLTFEVVAKTPSGVAAPKRTLVGDFRLPVVRSSSEPWADGFARSYVLVGPMPGRMGYARSQVQIEKDDSSLLYTRIELIAPDGSVYELYNGNDGSFPHAPYPADGVFEVDLSSEPMEGYWWVRLHTPSIDQARIHRVVFKPWSYR